MLFTQLQPTMPQLLALVGSQPSVEHWPLLQLAQGAPTATHSLSSLQTCGCVLLQREAPGRQRQRPPPMHSGSVPEQAVSLRQRPWSLHTRGVVPVQLRVPGTHSPAHWPFGSSHT
jgi:hypothetical protein